MFMNQKIIVTGHTGFKGSWLSCVLKYLGAEIVGISKDIPTSPSLNEIVKSNTFIEEHMVDVCDYEKVSNIISNFEPDFIFHLAAQSLVSVSYTNPLNTMNSNAIGTANILESLKLLSKPVIGIFITSDKAYYNSEWVYGYRENDRLGGIDPYSASKAMAELAISSFHNSFLKNKKNIKIGIARAGNVIGGGDWAKDRIVPDCIKSWNKNSLVKIRNPNSTRPWQHVLEPLSGYLTLAAKLNNNSINSGEAYNFGPLANQNRTVLELLIEMKKTWKEAGWSIPPKYDKKSFYESSLLKLNCDKALVELGWQPTLNFEETVLMTVEWYQNYYKGNKNMKKFTLNHIESFFSFAKSRKASWLKSFVE